MFISEIYPCMQGEGKLIGTPSILIRTSGCNLRCQWGETKCDTPFTSWNPTGENMTVDEVVTKTHMIRSNSSNVLHHIIISGGEPTIQKDLAQLVVKLKRDGFHITIETNGTGDIWGPVDLLSISPKLKSSTPVGSDWEKRHEETRINLGKLAHALDGHYEAYLKFVITDGSELPEITSILKGLWDQFNVSVKGSQIYLMPEGYTKAEIQKRQQQVLELAQHNGFNYSPRLHIDVYGDKRGV